MIDYIELAIPARAEFLQLARMAAGVVAARMDLGFEHVEDLRLAVEELCLSLIGPAGEAPARLHLRYGWDGTTIEVSCTLIGDDDTTSVDSREAETGLPLEALHRELSSQILDALVDEHGPTQDQGRVGAWLRVRRVGSDER